jgi:hypothetical protein
MSPVKPAAPTKGCDKTLLDDDNIVTRETLPTNHTAMLLRPSSENLSITDGPFAETKEHLGGILVLEADE